MAEIVLTTLNAKYIHAAFGLRCLMANLGDLRKRARILEFDINQRPIDIAEELLAEAPRVIGLGVYIWNTGPATELVGLLKRLRPDLIIVLGGPEVSHEVNAQPIIELADFVITGEADLKFPEVCRALLEGDRPAARIIPSPVPKLEDVTLPYDLYDDQDIAHRVIYVEASRGCPFTCEFCLSSLDVPVRQVPLDPFLHALQRLLDRGVKQFKFVDRTFNLNLNTSRAILEFLLARYQPGHFYHFEMIPDRLPAGLKDLIVKFPPGALQFEVGIQTFNEEVAGHISRRQNYERLAENFRFLRGETGVHIHADLIVGLPGESVASFGRGFDRLIELGPQEIQVGILKRLRGTPLVRHDTEWEMVYSGQPPYEILRTKLVSFPGMQRMRRFARYWDLVGNSGNFVETTPLIWKHSGRPFDSLLRWSDWLYATVRRTHGVALLRLMELLFDFLTREAGVAPAEAAVALLRDYRRGGRGDTPNFLGRWVSSEAVAPEEGTTIQAGQKRQQRRLGGVGHPAN